MDYKIKTKEEIKKKMKKYSKKFSLFFLIGVFKTIFSIWLMWVIIDILRINALIGSTIVVVITFFITYWSYIIAKVIEPRFLKYASATIGFNIATILLIWFFVDFIGLSGALSSAIVIGILFILRYLFFSKIGLIQNE